VLAIEVLRCLAQLPLLARFGLIWLGAALAGDVLIHVAHDHELLGAHAHVLEDLAHVAVLIGMVLIYLGVLAHGLRSRLSRSTRPMKGV
jgi:hypothetical protein